jgi:hypothetical protein
MLITQRLLTLTPMWTVVFVVVGHINLIIMEKPFSIHILVLLILLVDRTAFNLNGMTNIVYSKDITEQY